MTDESKTKRDADELVLDWDDDAVDSWEQGFDSKATAEAAPFPARVETRTQEPKTSPPPQAETRTSVPSPSLEAKTSRPPALESSNERATLPPLNFAVKPAALPGLPGLPGLKPGSKPLFNPLPGPIPGLPSFDARKSVFESTPEQQDEDDQPSQHPDSRKTSMPPAFPNAHAGRSELPDYARTESGRPRMYRPPSDDERKELEAIGSLTLPPPANGPTLSWSDYDDEDGDNTRIAAIPRELIEAIARADAAERSLAERSQTVGSDRQQTEVSQLAPVSTDSTESLAAFVSESFGADLGSLSLDTDEAFSLRSSLPAPAMLVSEAPQIEIGTADDDDDDDFGDEFGDDFGDSEGDIENEPTGMRSLPPASLQPSDLHSIDPPKPLFIAARPPAAPLSAKKSPVPAREEPSVLRNLEELAPPSERPRAPSRAPEAPAGTNVAVENRDQKDEAAIAALRKIRAQKRRVDALPLLAGDEAGKRARIELLQSLSARNTGIEAAQLLVSAGEIAEGLNDAELARSLYEGATGLAPDLAAAHQGLGRLCLATGDLAVFVEGLERRAAQALLPRERARALAAVARVRWLVQRDFPAALRVAAEAARLASDEVGYAHLLSRIESAANPSAADATLMRLAEASGDPEMASLWWLSAGRALESRGELAQALSCYARAAEHKPSSLEAQLAVARTSLAASQREGAAQALQAVAPHLSTGPLRDAIERRASVLRGHASDSSSLADSTDPVSVRTAAELALNHPSATVPEHVVRRWVETAVGTERALAQLVLAELRAAASDLVEAEQALAAALESDPTFALVPVVRELLSRKYGSSLSASQPENNNALSAAAQLARDPGQLAREIEALLRARGEHLSPECTEVLLLDATAEAADVERARASLRSESERGTPEERVSTLLTLADYERRYGNAEQHRDALLTAADLDTRSVLVARALLRASPSDEQKVRVLRREAEASSGARAAFLLLRASHALRESPSERLEVIASAYEAASGYAPAMWALHQEARKQGNIERLSDLHAREAGRAKDPHEAIAHLVRAALVRAGDDADAAAAQLTRALDLMPSDPVLRELVIRLGDAVPATLRAEAIQSSAERAPTALKRPATLAAAAAFEDASQPARALALFESVLAEHPGDPIAEMGVERVARAAGKAAQLDEEKRRQLAAAPDARARRKALEALLESGAPGDRSEQLGFARSLLELVPTHPAALRVIERRSMETNDHESLWEIQERLATASAGSKDKLSRLRLLSLLALLRTPEKAGAERLDDLVTEAGLSATRGLWLGRQLMSTAASRHDLNAMRKAAELTSASVTDHAELSTLAVQGAVHDLRTAAADAVERLTTARELTPVHPTLIETLAEAHEAAGNLAEAADLFEESARQSHTKQRIARLHYRAGILLQERIQAPDRAREAYQRAAEANIGFKDVQARLEQLLSGRNDLAGLVALAEARLNAAQVPQLRLELARKLAQLYVKQDEHGKAVTVLRAALELNPEDLPGLSQFEGLLNHTENQRERAEILVRMARLSRDPDELCDVFFKLGDIYDVHLPDPRRAEAAYRRVMKLAPKHQAALERLSALLKRGGQTELAAESLERLMQVAERPSQRRDVAFELSRLKEDAADFRGAEEVLERLRKSSPTDLVVLRTMAEFYRRRQAQSALAMHLNRAANDLRLALSGHPENAELWSTLVEVLEEKGRKDAASAAASAAFSLGHTDSKLARHVDSDGSVSGLGTGAFSELLDDLVFPNLMPASVRILFRHGAEAMNRAAPVDLKTLAGEKLERKHPLRAVASELAKLAGLGDAEVFVTAQLPYAFVPVSDAPFQILVGRTILGSLSPLEQRYLVARACKIARAQMSITCRVRPEEMATLLGGLIGAQVPDYRVQGVEPAMLDEMARRIGKHLSRRAREDMLPHAVELAGQPELDLTRAYLLASTAGNRAALLATGSVPAAMSALTKLGGILENRAQASVLGEIEEAKDLLSFSISEPHFEARQRAGAERR